MEGTVVLYPAIGISHLVPMVELAKLLLGHGLSATVVIPPAAMIGAGSLDAFASRVISAHPAISFHTLPPVSLPDGPPIAPVRIYEILCLSNPLLLDFLRSLAETTTIRALVLDFFCTQALDVAAELRLPSYIFFSTSASNLAAFLYLPTPHNQITTSFCELGDNPIHFPGIPPMPASSLPKELQDRDGEPYKQILFHFDRLSKSDGIIANTFRSLEKRALTAIKDGLCVPGRPASPVYCIGPLIAGDDDGEQQKHECLSWLDSQPKQSVVFLCFGSMGGTFSAGQLIEIATGLERSGQRFLWVVRDPMKTEPDLDALMPDGFLQRTAERGMVVKSWAPQVAVLSHESVGGFVTHCGWNSVLEAIRTGVPMIAWPLYAEQRMNKVHLVEGMKLAADLKRDDKGVVSAAEVEGRVRWLMESEGGRELRERALVAKESAMVALKEGGSSHAELMEFVIAVKRGTSGLDE